MTLNPDPSTLLLASLLIFKMTQAKGLYFYHRFCFFFICESKALLVPLLCLLGMEQGNTRELEGIFLECEATLTFENNSVAGENNNNNKNLKP